ncbi:hypothetical protein ACIQLJ_00095 [Microbacterium sp. NPDC091313]
MHEIMFAGERLLTTDAVADALLQYAHRLAELGRHDVVAIPVIEDGAATTCRLLLAPTTSLGVVRQSRTEAQLPGADEAFTDLSERMASLRVS